MIATASTTTTAMSTQGVSSLESVFPAVAAGAVVVVVAGDVEVVRRGRGRNR